MPQGDKSSYTKKQKRQAAHIEKGYEKKGVGKKESERRAWATVNKTTGGGRKRGAGRKKSSSTHSKRHSGGHHHSRSSSGHRTASTGGRSRWEHALARFKFMSLME